MSLSLGWRIAKRELRGGLRGFWVFLACLTLGVAAIAAVGSVRAAIQQGLLSEGASLLGGDAEVRFTYRFASSAEKEWMAATGAKVSEVVDFRSMAVVAREGQTERALTQIKAIDSFYPLYGAIALVPEQPLETALAGQGDLPGGIMDQALIDRLGLSVGDTFRLGTQDFVLMAALRSEPDRAGDGFGLGPRTMVRTADLSGSSLLSEGTLFDSKYRLKLPDGTDLNEIEADAIAQFENTGLRWRDSRNGAPGISAFVDRMGSFLVLVGLAGLAVGGIGVSAAVRAYLVGKTEMIAVLKTLGAQSSVIFWTYFLQIGVLSLVGVAGGLMLGAALPLVAGPLVEAQLPLPLSIGIYPLPLIEAAIYGFLTALIFTLWPLARTERIRAASLFRDVTNRLTDLPRPVYWLMTAGLFVLLVGLAAWLSGVAILTLWAAAGLLAALTLLVIAAWSVKLLARRVARSSLVQGRTAWRLAFGAVGGPGGEATSVVLSLGLGLTVLAAVGQIDANLRNAISGDLPEVAPSYFVVDIQNDQLGGFLERVNTDEGVSRVQTAPMLRGIITRINGKPAKDVAGDHWVLNGDRGVTYSDQPTPETTLTAGEWWPESYAGPPQISFAAEEAEEMGLTLGDMMTVNILGRDIEGQVTSFREVDFSTAGIGFILSMNPSALAGAPHTHIATVYAEEAAEAAILRDIAQKYPNITAIRVRDAITRVAEIVGGLAAAITYGAGATLITGVIVLIGAAAAGQRMRVFEAALLKTVGAVRGQILGYFALRSLLLGLAAGVVAVLCGAVAGWAVTVFVMEGDYVFEPVSAALIIFGGIAATMLTGLGFAMNSLAARPARILRARE